jgi:hypothetical protein
VAGANLYMLASIEHSLGNIRHQLQIVAGLLERVLEKESNGTHRR